MLLWHDRPGAKLSTMLRCSYDLVVPALVPVPVHILAAWDLHMNGRLLSWPDQWLHGTILCSRRAINCTVLCIVEQTSNSNWRAAQLT